MLSSSDNKKRIELGIFKTRKPIKDDEDGGEKVTKKASISREGNDPSSSKSSDQKKQSLFARKKKPSECFAEARVDKRMLSFSTNSLPKPFRMADFASARAVEPVHPTTHSNPHRILHHHRFLTPPPFEMRTRKDEEQLEKVVVVHRDLGSDSCKRSSRRKNLGFGRTDREKTATRACRPHSSTRLKFGGGKTALHSCPHPSPVHVSYSRRHTQIHEFCPRTTAAAAIHPRM
ncbi:unnamed protein product [Nippostrongylus brasiliensis]|uniref:TPX2_importin domain-containing protein n=1 Tax=Nippostrongylus brasiliensis TaxID=27835 RepID=A0A0N4YJM1_NIPBR|nr:unnamed protein product [Nippostrongylus brasiliensis]